MSEEKEAIDYLKNDVVYWLDKGKDFVVIDIGENEKLHSILNLIEKQQKEIEEKTTIIMAGAEKVKQLEKDYISRDKIREKIKNIEDIYQKEMKPYQTEYGLNVSLLSKKEKEELINKRNGLLTQKITLEELLEEN